MFDTIFDFFTIILSFLPEAILTLIGILVGYKAVLYFWQLLHGG